MVCTLCFISLFGPVDEEYLTHVVREGTIAGLRFLDSEECFGTPARGLALVE